MSVVGAVQRWARGHTEQSRYSPVGIAFHWIMAFLILFQLGWGFYASWVPAGGDKLWAYQVHSAAGLPVLVLALSLSAALNAPIPDTRFGVFRM